MLFLRRLRKRRAKKDAARQSLVEKISKASGERSKAIFRGRWGNDSTDVCVHDGLFANATNPTQDEDDSSSTLSSPRGALLTLGQKNEVLSKGGNAMVYNYEEILDLQAEIEELKIVHGEVIDNKDETIFNGLVELGFAKDDIQKVMIELDEVSKVLQNREEQIQATEAELQDKDDQLNQTISDLEETKEVLAAISAELEESQKMMKAKDETIASLEKSLKHGKTGAKVVFGLLTLGALCADEH